MILSTITFQFIQSISVGRSRRSRLSIASNACTKAVQSAVDSAPNRLSSTVASVEDAGGEKRDDATSASQQEQPSTVSQKTNSHSRPLTL